jgi:hypothetical protein
MYCILGSFFFIAGHCLDLSTFVFIVLIFLVLCKRKKEAYYQKELNLSGIQHFDIN